MRRKQPKYIDPDRFKEGKTDMKKFKVWFNQVNQMVYEVLAKSKEEAEEKARKLWNREFKDPSVSYMEEHPHYTIHHTIRDTIREK